MSRIAARFAELKAQHRAGFVPFVTAGDPDFETSLAILKALPAAGADVIELGMPFSDPMADGPAVQASSLRALKAGGNMNRTLDLVREFRKGDDKTPIVLMGYYNPLLSYGLERFCQDAAASGVCGLIIPDLPPEEATRLQQAAIASGLTLVFLVPPTTPDERIAQIAAWASNIPGSFIYCVSLSGVTGARGELPEHLPAFLARVYSYTRAHSLSVVVGFGLSRPEHIASVVGLADGAVVGSALVKLLDEHNESEQVEAVRDYVRSLHEATRQG